MPRHLAYQGAKTNRVNGGDGEEDKVKKSDYRKFIIKGVEGVDDFASMREVVTRRYKRVQEEKQTMPSLVLIDGGIGQLHAAAQALEPGKIYRPAAGLHRPAQESSARPGS